MVNKEEKIWVHLETNKGTNNMISSYRGSISLNDFNEWISGRLNKKCIKLSEAYWVVNEWEDTSPNGQQTRVALYKIPGFSKDNFNICTGEIFLIVEYIVAIYVLKDCSERGAAISQNPLIWDL